MKPYILLSLATALAAAATSPALAQSQSSMVQALPGTTDADRLAEQMRALAADPRDLNALLNAGELSLKLDDLSAAAALFARADKIDPRNARVKAGMGSILVRSERPGEALRYFQQATQLGLDQRRFAADRGLAYDLIGEQARAQRDYRLALQGGADDETIRRYALSLAIAGQREQALSELDPLLRKTDRGAWRTRAFVLAMGGDVQGATRIATTMMPPGTAEGLQPFFQRLPQLGPVDRAFAVHFGEIVATPSRIADARLTPPLPALGPDTSGPVRVAAAPVATPAPVQTASTDSRQERRNKRNRREKPGRVALPDDQQPVQLASATQALPPPPTYVAPVYQPPEPLPPTVSSRRSRRGSGASAAADANRAALAAAKSGQPLPTPVATTPPVQVASISQRPAPVVQPLPRQSYSVAAAAPVRTVAPTPVQTVAPTPLPTVAPAPTLAAVPATPPPAIVAAPRESGDTVLARIIAGLTIPASELEPAKTPDRAIAPAPTASAKVRTAAAEHVLAAARAKEARDQAADKALADAAAKEDRRAAAAKLVADRKALADKKAATAKKLAEAKEAAEEKKAARSNPSRIWVQVAGGANEDDLPKAWSAAKAKASALSGKPGYTAKLRATNRVLTGPFKTQAEAQKAVAELRKQGIGAFAFTSDAGQAVTKLPAK